MKKVDAIVLGSGIAGLSAAIALRKRGKKVLVISKPHRGEASFAAAGILDPLLEMEENSPILPLALECFEYYPKFLKWLQRKTGKNTSYKKTGMLLVAASNREEISLKDRYRWHRKTGVPAKYLNKKEAQKYSNALTDKLQAAIYYPTVGRVQPARFLNAVKRAAEKIGVEFLQTRSQVKYRTSSGAISAIQLGRQTLQTELVINAMGSWMGQRKAAGLKIPVDPIRGQIMIVKSRQLSDVILHSSKGYYSVPWNSGEYLLGSTVEDVGFRPEVTSVGLKSIRRGLKQMVPEIENYKTLRSWSGLRPRAKDLLPIIGSSRVQGLYILTGFFRSGILLGPLAGELLVEGIEKGKYSKLLKPFNPMRFKAC